MFLLSQYLQLNSFKINNSTTVKFVIVIYQTQKIYLSDGDFNNYCRGVWVVVGKNRCLQIYWRIWGEGTTFLKVRRRHENVWVILPQIFVNTMAQLCYEGGAWNCTCTRGWGMKLYMHSRVGCEHFPHIWGMKVFIIT